MPLFSRSDSGANFFSTLSHLRQKMGQGDFSPTAKSPSPKARVKGDDLPFLFKGITEVKIHMIYIKTSISHVEQQLIFVVVI